MNRLIIAAMILAAMLTNALSAATNNSAAEKGASAAVTNAVKSIVFLKDAKGWYADIEGTREENAMVAGADVLIEKLSRGGKRVEMEFSFGAAKPAKYLMHLHRVEHDAWGATYRVNGGTDGEAPDFKGMLGRPLVWLCNQTHRFLGADHPLDIYVHRIAAGSSEQP